MNPYWRESYIFACSHNLAGYVPPGYNLVRNRLLDEEKVNVHKLLEPIRAMWNEKGVSIVSDGWSDSQRRPLINFIAISDGQPIFLKAVDCSGETKDKGFIADLLKNVIENIGSEKVVQVITDNAPNCRGAGQLIEGQFPNIFWTPCVVHTLNLALKNICSPKFAESNMVAYEACSWITKVGGDAILIKNFIMNHSMMLSMYNEFVHLKLLSIAETRFASLIVMLRRFKLIKTGLQAMVISEKWALYKEDDVGKARFVKEKVLSDEFWENIDYIIAFTEPIYNMIRLCDTDKPCLHLIYDMWDSMIENVKKTIFVHENKNDDEYSPFYDVVHSILVARWNKNNTPLHCLADSLNPRYYSDQWQEEDPKRVPPHRDPEVTRERIKCFKKYFPDFSDRHKITLEYVSFIDKSGDFNDYDSIRNRYILDPKVWWLTHGTSTPILQAIALKVLVQPSSSSCAERNWSTFSFIHNMKRNKLLPKRAENLVDIHSNLRLLARKNPKYTREPEIMLWDICGDTPNAFEDVGLLDVATLTLDELELELQMLEAKISVGATNEHVV